MEIYKDRIKKYGEAFAQNRRKDRAYSGVRLTVMLAALFFAWLGISQRNFGWLMAAGGLLIIFVILLFLHNDVREYSRRLKAYIRINEDELKYLEKDLSSFGDGAEFIDSDHFYAYDLDIFGKGSLFHHLNRSATLEGKKLLAKALASQKAEKIPERQKAVAELGGDIKFRQEFLVEAGLLEEDPDLLRKLRLWNDDEARDAGILNKWLLYFLSALAIAGLTYWILFPSLQSFYIFMGLGLMNLLIVMSRIKTIKRKYGQLDGISKSLMMYGKLLKQVEERDHRAEYLQELRGRLEKSADGASGALLKLSRILGSFDQLANMVAMPVMNGLFLYHLHSLRNLKEWKESHGEKVKDWIAVVALFDELCSFANFAYNHQDFAYPKPVAEPHFEAKEAGHPLIPASKRVNNSIDFSTYQYVVLTGSNMSGKSTFLKTLGTNLVLAKAGAPVCASEMKFFPFTILTSMKMVDSIQKEESYFQAEILRLKRLQDVLHTGEPCFVLLDEILRGTNSDDKRNGTRLFMERIAAFKAKGVIATHDIDIADLAQKREEIFKAKFFESKFVDGELSFDYKLRNGICTTPNATELMRLHGIIGSEGGAG